KSRESMLLCEAAGFEVILIETVGVGQSETAVNNMVDFFLLLMLAGAGDELQGIKKGIMEIADAVVITKSDGDNKDKAQLAQAEYTSALHLFPPSSSGWYPKVLTCSAVENRGLDKIWQLIMDFQQLLTTNGQFSKKREDQNIAWMYEVIKQELESQFYKHAQINAMLKDKEEKVKNGMLHAVNAARELLEVYKKNYHLGI
ncbi:MAG: methylmalonyl Co-A mutase-associated GTPase MeaB, partial [Thermoflexibacter sp.]|nr:methylmalonyl Co-A mutase-associated GTPase MeaB [Thermoflexibacter sp.]